MVGRELTPQVAAWIGQAVGNVMADKGLTDIVVGRDGRLSGPELAGGLIEGLRKAGRNVIDVGMVPTPVVYFAAYHLRAGSGVAVTGSHNPPDYNGFKIVVGGQTLSGDAIQDLGERIREGHELWHDMQGAGVMPRTLMVFGQMDESPGVRFRIGLAALTYAEYLRDNVAKDVLFLMDNAFRFVQAGSELSGLLGRMPATVGYQPTLLSEVAELQERIISTKTGSITAVEAVYVPADDMTDPAVSAILAHLDTTIILSRKQAAKGIYPAVDPLISSSVAMSRSVIGARHYRVAQGVRECLSRYRELEDIIAILGLESTGAWCIARGGSSAT